MRAKDNETKSPSSGKARTYTHAQATKTTRETYNSHSNVFIGGAVEHRRRYEDKRTRVGRTWSRPVMSYSTTTRVTSHDIDDNLSGKPVSFSSSTRTCTQRRSVSERRQTKQASNDKENQQDVLGRFRRDRRRRRPSSTPQQAAATQRTIYDQCGRTANNEHRKTRQTEHGIENEKKRDARAARRRRADCARTARPRASAPDWRAATSCPAFAKKSPISF
jgi:hypothetical protein